MARGTVINPSFLISSIDGFGAWERGPLEGLFSQRIEMAGCDYDCALCHVPHLVHPDLIPQFTRKMTLTQVYQELSEKNINHGELLIHGANPFSNPNLGYLTAQLNKNFRVRVIGTVRQFWINVKAYHFVLRYPCPSALESFKIDSQTSKVLMDSRNNCTVCDVVFPVHDPEDVNYVFEFLGQDVAKGIKFWLEIHINSNFNNILETIRRHPALLRHVEHLRVYTRFVDRDEILAQINTEDTIEHGISAALNLPKSLRTLIHDKKR